MFVLAIGCGDVKPLDVDAPPVSPDSSIDTPDSADAMPPAKKRRGGIASTSGGGVTTSAQHRLRVRVGAPDPMGQTASAGHKLTTGPGSLP